ncbi:hypothetical protein BJV77DRAFT_975603, partial [Russula vinacea]
MSASRPASVASSYRPSSRTSRPHSSASTRPISRTGHVPSKFSQRLPSRQMSRIISLCHTLVSQLTGLQPEDEDGEFRALADIVIRSLDYNTKAAPSSSMNDITKQLHGRTERARINSQDSWADALEHSFSLLKSKAAKIHDIDSEITPTHLPNHLMFLILLSVPPTPLAVEHAELYLESSRTPRVDPVSISWKTILDEEPFEGQHWEGIYGLPPGSTVEGWETRSLDSTPPYSPLPLGDPSDLSPSVSSTDSLPSVEAKSSLNQDVDLARMATVSSFGHRQLIEDLQRRQYWRTEWQTDAASASSFAIKNASSLGPSVDLIFAERNSSKHGIPYGVKYIHEHDAVREVLMAFQGYKNSFLIWAESDNGTFSFEPTPDAPRIIHLTEGSQLSVTQSFAQTASTVEHLRRFVTCISGRTAKLNSRAADDFRLMTRTVEAFSEAVEIQIGLFNSWCANREREIILSFIGKGSPLTVSLLKLEKAVHDSTVMRKASGMRDKNKEVWMLLDLPIRLSPFTMSTLLLDTLLTAADSSSSNGDIETSKALMQVFTASAEPVWSMTGLWLKHGMPTQDQPLVQEGDSLTALDDEFFIQDNGFRRSSRILDLPLINDAAPEPTWMTKWPTFTALLHEHHATALVETSKEHLARFIPQKQLAQMAISECDLWKGDALLYFSDTLFGKIEPTLVRFSYSGSRDKASKGTIDALDNLLVEYAAPFPLTYIFGMHASGIYCSIFVFLLQIRRAKNVLEGAHMRDIANHIAMRSKLIWFINTLLNFIATHVSDYPKFLFSTSVLFAGRASALLSFHAVQRLESECLLQTNVYVRLRQAIISVLNMTLRFHSMIAWSSTRVGSRSHYGRREQEGRRRGSIGFARTSREAALASDSESDLEEEEALRLGSFGSHHDNVPPVSRDGQQLFGDIYEMQDELDKLVRFVQREVEGLAGGTSGTASLSV